MTGFNWMIPVLLVQLLLPVVCAVTGTLYKWPVTGLICILAALALVYRAGDSAAADRRADCQRPGAGGLRLCGPES